MKIYMLFLMVLLLAVGLCSCGCDHEWNEAGCTTPKACALCQETEGEPLGHSWAEATCETPKTCTLCGETEGEAPGHSWVDADCETAKTCTVCSETEGDPLGHTWIDATTETPKTCAVCAATEGERIITDPRFVTAQCEPLFGSWKGQITMTAEENGLYGVEGEIVFDVVFTFGSNGEVTQLSTFADWESTKLLFKEYVMLAWYSQAAAQGMDTAAADAAMKTQYGMTVEEYAQAYVDSIDLDTASEPATMVYYVDGSNLCMAYSWDEEMQVSMYSMDGNSLVLITLPDFQMLELTRVTE